MWPKQFRRNSAMAPIRAGASAMKRGMDATGTEDVMRGGTAPTRRLAAGMFSRSAQKIRRACASDCAMTPSVTRPVSNASAKSSSSAPAGSPPAPHAEVDQDRPIGGDRQRAGVSRGRPRPGNRKPSRLISSKGRDRGADPGLCEAQQRQLRPRATATTIIAAPVAAGLGKRRSEAAVITPRSPPTRSAGGGCRSRCCSS